MNTLRVTVVALLASALVALSGIALAQTGSANQPPEIGPGRINRPGPGVAPEVQPRGEALPFTGADLTLFVVVGAGAIGVGTLVVRATRRGTSQS